MTDFTGKGMMWSTNVKAAIAITEPRSKNVEGIRESFKSHGFIVKPQDQDYSNTVAYLKSLDWIKETKDAYILTEKGKKEVEKYKNLPWYLH